MKRNTLFLLAAILVAVLLLAGTAFAEEGETREVADLEKLNEAIADPNVDIIKLTENIENVDSPITITRSLTLDLGGFTISENGKIGKGYNNGVIMIKGGNSGEIITVTISNGKIESTTSSLAAIRADGGKTNARPNLTLEKLNVNASGSSANAFKDAGYWNTVVKSGEYVGKAQFPFSAGKCY